MNGILAATPRRKRLWINRLISVVAGLARVRATLDSPEVLRLRLPGNATAISWPILWMRALAGALTMVAVTAFGEQPARLPAIGDRATATDAEGAGDIIVEKASYAFPEVRELALSLVRESATKIDTDGINLCFVRGPHFLQFEEPIIRTFRERYDEDAREVPELDERLLQVRAEFMTKFVREAREVLDQVGRQKGKQLTLSVWVWPSKRNVWLGKTPLQEGLDVKEWIRQGLLDSVICQQGIDSDYIELGRGHHCKFILFTGYRGDLQMSPTTVRDAYHRGVESFAYWDIDAAQLFPDVWRWLRHIGHRDAIENWATGGLPKDSFLPLTKINGADAKHGLADAVYSGG